MKTTLSRRELVMMLPALAATNVAAQQQQSATLPAKVYHSEQIPYTGDATKKGRRFFYGAEHSGFNLEAHETVLGAGTETHPPHTHEHEEIIILVEGTVQVFVDGKTETVEAGSVIYYGPNRPHSLRNAGTTPCRYYVIELRGRNA
jgi:quercetin dioxygenase-like cupin family protein